jgi:hypothetical protein
MPAGGDTVITHWTVADALVRYDLKLWIGSGDGSAAYLPG